MAVRDGTQGLRRAGQLAALAALVVLAAPIMTAPANALATGPTLVNEDFRGATAISEFEGYGSACLTGAPAELGAVAGIHTLLGCPAAATGPVPPQGGAPDGYLRLTDASNDQAGAVLYTQPLPSTGGVEISFEQWQYGGTQTPAPADGIAFFLVDGATTLDVPGAFGGSLGYAQKLPDSNPANAMIPGVSNGYLGIGLDALGNFFGDWESRGQGCPASGASPSGTAFRVPAPGTNMVTVRGPGDGTSGYCFLTATTSNFTTNGPWPSTLPGQLHGPLLAMPPGTSAAEAAVLLEPSKRVVTIEITAVPDPRVTVWVDFGSGPQQVLSFDAPQPVPATYKFGFAASTGGFTDVHLIRTVKVQAIDPLPALDLVKQVARTSGPAPQYASGDSIPFEFVVTNSGEAAISGITVVDPLVTSITCPVSTLDVGESMTCTGSYTVTPADVARGYVVNTAFATGTGPRGPIDSPPSEVTTPLGGPTSIDLEKTVDASAEYAVGQSVDYEYVLSNVGATVITDVIVEDDHLTGIVCESTTLEPSGMPGSSTICRGTYVITAADALAGTVTNIAHAFGNARSVLSPPAQATIRVVAATPAPSPSPTPSPSPELATSGVAPFPVMATGLGLLAVGLLFVSRRRRPGSATPKG